ncbi:unnamed protein product [Moneuplotes crassus]|uniref:Sm domain-containing protein n=1 Tax=Euplotes crassus TaxID=5936 RepID=A0AAD2D7J5_EUPCR|nr:unnamed protein product [Moneuplotes crassus]
MINISSVEQPLDLPKLIVSSQMKDASSGKGSSEKVYVKCKGNRELTGTLIVYDVHMNILLKDCVETVTKRSDDEDEDTPPEIITNHHPFLYMRGDLVILLSVS